MTKHLLLLVLVCCTFSTSAQILKVLTYNVANSVEHKRGNLSDFQSYIKQLDVDVAAFQAIEGMSEKGLQQWAKKWKHAHAAILQTDAYAIALTSKYPLENIKKSTVGLEHGYLYAEVSGVGIYTTQLTDESAKARKAEAELLAQDVATNGREAIVLLGALHSYAPQDSMLYNQRFRRVPKEDRYEREVIMQLASYQRKRNYEVLYALQGSGLEDVLANRRGMDTVIEVTYPTTGEVPEYQQHRLDYILCNANAAIKCEKIELLSDKNSRRLSKHYPLMATFRLEKSVEGM